MRISMKKIGILGGMSWESTQEYYRILNTLTAEVFGGLHSAPCLISSVDFAPLAELMHDNNWDGVKEILLPEAKNLAGAGAQLLIIGTNTIHYIAEEIQAAAGIQLIHIADAVGEECGRRGIRKAALLGTMFTMELDFYSQRLLDRYGIETAVPVSEDREKLDGIIFRELCRGEFKESSTVEVKKMAENLAGQGCEGVILGCTELPLIVKEGDLSMSVLDTMELHARAVFRKAVEG